VVTIARRGDAATAGGRLTKAWATADLNTCLILKPNKCVPAAALAPLVVATLTVGDEEPLPGSKQLK